MVRKGFWCGLSFILGLFVVKALDVSLWWIIALSVLLVCGIFAAVSKSLRVYLVVCGCAFASGCVYCAGYTYFVCDEIKAFDGKTVTIEGYVDDYKYIGHGQGYLTVKGKLSDHTTKISFLVSDDDYEYYDKVAVEGKVTRVKDSYNFLAQSYYSSDGVFLKGDGAAHVNLLVKNAYPMLRAIRNYSDRVFTVIGDYAGDDEKGFLGAMLCGDKSEMEPAAKNMLYRSGIGHIFAVSGTHLVILTAVIGSIIGLFIKSRRLKAVILICMAWIFVVFAGMSISVIRSAILLTVVYAGDLFLRNSDCANSLGIAGLILGISNPYCASSPAFILSFVSAFAAGAAAPYICRRLKITRKKLFLPVKALVTSCTVSVFIAPVCLVYFGGFSVLAPLLNVMLIPLCTAALVLCFLVAVTGGLAFIAKPLLFAASWLIKIVFAAVRYFSKLSLLYVTGSGKAGCIILITVCTCVLLVVCFGKKRLYSAFAAAVGALLCVLFSNIFILLSSENFEMYVFAYKKSCTTVIVQSDKAVVFDLDSKGKFIGACERVITKSGVRSVDAVFINSEISYTAGRYKDKIYPYIKDCYSAVPIGLDMPYVSLIDKGDSKHLDRLNVNKINNGFEVIFNSDSFRLYPDCFYINDDKYDTDGTSVYYSSNDEKVRRLDYELGITDYSW